MALIIWDKALSVGVNEMDDQHKKLIEIINNLFEAMKIGMGRETLNYVFSGLIDYAKKHFFDEKELMKKYSFPGPCNIQNWEKCSEAMKTLQQLILILLPLNFPYFNCKVLLHKI